MARKDGTTYGGKILDQCKTGRSSSRPYCSCEDHVALSVQGHAASRTPRLTWRSRILARLHSPDWDRLYCTNKSWSLSGSTIDCAGCGLTVYRMGKLSVVDASVMPCLPAAHICTVPFEIGVGSNVTAHMFPTYTKQGSAYSLFPTGRLASASSRI